MAERSVMIRCKRCVNCDELPRVRQVAGSLPWEVHHFCISVYSLTSHQKTRNACATAWNEHNGKNRSDHG